MGIIPFLNGNNCEWFDRVYDYYYLLKGDTHLAFCALILWKYNLIVPIPTRVIYVSRHLNFKAAGETCISDKATDI